MADESIFHSFFLLIFLGVLSISAFFRARARRLGGTIPRAREGKRFAGARLILAAPLYLPLVAYPIYPPSMEWASLPLPLWVRWVGVVVGVAMLPSIYWVMVSIGKNVSETYLTKEGHELVQHGPYRWVRHPLYSVATTTFLALGLVSANAYLLIVAVLAMIGIASLVVPKEEAELIRKFGAKYQEYQKRTGRFFPRMRTGP
ncbi:MAG: isoprenylcysteine carboxylmethyltransferase family protein [Anaerolineales bacterium]